MLEDPILSMVTTLYKDYMETEKDYDFVINETQYDKMMSIHRQFEKYALELNGEVEPLQLCPREEVGNVTAKFHVIDFYGERLKRLIDILKDISVIGIDVEEDRICISITIPNVFVRKGK